MSQYFVYIIQSTSTQRYYCGYTDNLKQRLKQHNSPKYNASKTTKRISGPWILVWNIAIHSLQEALALEKQIKKRGIKRYLKSLAE